MFNTLHTNLPDRVDGAFIAFPTDLPDRVDGLEKIPRDAQMAQTVKDWFPSIVSFT